MLDTSKQPDKPKRRRSDSKRLDSWKAISGYMNRSVRTLRRWEENENLPIHRHRHNSGDTVYAYCSELDEWRNSQPGQAASIADNPPPQQLYRPGLATAMRRYVAAGVVGAAIAVMAVAFVAQFLPEDRSTVSNASDLEVLVSPPVLSDETGTLDTALITAMHREIESSIDTRVVPEERVRGILQLMRMGGGESISPRNARELLLRDRHAELLLIPYVAATGNDFLVSIEAVARGGNVVDFRKKTVRTPAEIPSTIASLASESVAAYRPSTVPAAVEMLPAVTVASLPALRLYTHALKALQEDKPGAASRFLELAVEQEPEFASAWTLLGWAMHRLGSGYQSLVPVYETATRHVNGISAVERYFVEGSYQQALSNRNMAAANYNALFAIDPTHEPAAMAALTLCIETRPPSDCLDQHIRVADLRPNHLESNARTAWLLAANGIDPAQARKYADRAMALYQQNSNGPPPDSIAKTLLFPVLFAWIQSDVQLALAEHRQLREQLPSLAADVREFIVERLGNMALAMGRLKEASELFDQITDQKRRYELQARVMFARGDMQAWSEHLASGNSYTDPFTVMLLALAGMTAEASDAFAALPDEKVTETESAIIRAALALNERDADFAIAQVEKTLAQLRPSDEEFYFLGLDMYARLMKERGQLPAAISTLEITAFKQQTAAFNDAGLFWLMCQKQLAQFYRAAGRNNDAAAIDFQLQKMFKYADGDHVAHRSSAETAG